MGSNQAENFDTNGSSTAEHAENTENNGDNTEAEVDIVINNVVSSFSVRCHLNLRHIALNGRHVEFRRESGMVTMKIRRPMSTASMWSSGKITCTGATSEEDAKTAARKFARQLQKLGYKVRFHNYRVVNVLGTCSMPFTIKITQFTNKYRDCAQYEPELHPGVTYRIKSPKATLKIYSTGSITVTAASVAFVQSAIEHIYPLVSEFGQKKVPSVAEVVPSNIEKSYSKRTRKKVYYGDDDEEDDVDDDLDPNVDKDYDADDPKDDDDDNDNDDEDIISD